MLLLALLKARIAAFSGKKLAQLRVLTLIAQVVPQTEIASCPAKVALSAA